MKAQGTAPDRLGVVSADRAWLIGEAASAAADQAWTVLSGRIAGRAKMRLMRAGKYPAAAQRPLSGSVPSRPAAVLVHGRDGCCACLCLDLDAKRGHTPADVDRDRTALIAWLTAHGAAWFTDTSISGGAHVYVPLAQRLPFDRARELVEALARRLPTLDAGPHRSITDGCIRPTGSPHRLGGWQLLTVPLAQARRAITDRTTPEVVAALEADLAAERAAVHAERAAAATRWDDDEDEVLPAGLVATAGLSARIRYIALAGYDPAAGYDSPSEARQAVITGAVRAGLTLADIAARVEGGTWAGLASLYARYTPHHRREALRRDCKKARAFLTTAGRHMPNPVRKSTTSQPGSQGAGGGLLQTPTTPTPNRRARHVSPSVVVPLDPEAELRHVRSWITAVTAVEHREWAGRGGITRRLVLRALAAAAATRRSRRVAFGTRSLSVMLGADHTTVAAHLRALREEPDPWVRLVEAGQGEAADLYELVIPARHQVLERLSWVPGKHWALRPAFWVLGPVAALTFEALERRRAHDLVTLVRATGLSRSGLAAAVADLTAWGLVERRAGALVPHPERLERVAAELGADDTLHTLVARHRAERTAWHAWLVAAATRHADRVSVRALTTWAPGLRPVDPPWEEMPMTG